MENFLLFVCGVLLVAVLYFWSKSKSAVGNLNELKQSIENQFFNFSRQIDERISTQFKMHESTEARMKYSLDEANKSYKSVEEKLNSLSEASRKIYEVGKDVASLNSLFKSPKIRGGLGEFFLEDLLSQVIPVENFEMQYTFSNGEKVDAVIKLTGNKMVCVDSKFPLENFIKLQECDPAERTKIRKQFLKDAKKHAASIAEKYINPLLGTFDFALMYIPAENVYYEMILNTEEEDLMAFCYQNKVIPVSPNNLFVYLQTILIGLKGFHIEQNAKYIYDLLSQLGNQFSVFNEDFQVLGTHLTKAKNKYESSGKALNSLQATVQNIAQEKYLK